MLVISDVRGSGARRQVATCGLHGREFATSITLGDSGLLMHDGPFRAEGSHLENPGKSTAKRAILLPSAGPSPGLHQKCQEPLSGQNGLLINRSAQGRDVAWLRTDRSSSPGPPVNSGRSGAP